MSKQRILKHPLLIVSVFLCVFTIFIACKALSENTYSEQVSSQITPLSQEEDPAKDIVFVAVGDTGSGLSWQKQVAAQMNRQYQKEPFPFVLMLGDNIYHDGNIKKYAKEKFLDPYQFLLEKEVQFYPVLGNHDVLSGYEDDQIEFFRMPGFYYDFVQGNIHFLALNTNKFDDVQRQWLIKKLSTSTAPWKIVYGHHPVYSSGEHGSTPVLVNQLKPILEKYRVQLYLSGHEHNYERFAPINNVTYIVSGGGGASLRKFRTIQRNSLVRESLHHFMVFWQKEGTLYFQTIDSQGRLIDQGTIEKQIPHAKAS